jgi:hypothetical protein
MGITAGAEAFLDAVCDSTGYLLWDMDAIGHLVGLAKVKYWTMSSRFGGQRLP